MAAPLVNRLLESIPASEQAALKASMQAVALPLATVLFEAYELPQYTYLFTSGLGSVIAPMTGGEAVEVGLIGREGISGTTFLLGSQLGSSRCLIQVEGSALRIPFQVFQRAFREMPGLHRRVLEFVQYDFLSSRQLSACNRVHEVEERLARWLLTVADRLGQPEVPLTHEFLAHMLGTRRSTVTVAAGTLQRAGLIEYHRGLVRILDRESLEDATCECYAITRGFFQNLYPDAAPITH